MKLEFLSDGSCDGSNDGLLLRMYDFEVAEIEQLFAAVLALASGDQEHYEVHNQPGVDAISGCKFFLCVGNRDRGTGVLPEPASFECVLTPDGWEQVASLVEPFLEQGEHGYQWLDSSGDVRWLLSRDGDW